MHRSLVPWRKLRAEAPGALLPKKFIDGERGRTERQTDTTEIPVLRSKILHFLETRVLSPIEYFLRTPILFSLVERYSILPAAAAFCILQFREFAMLFIFPAEKISIILARNVVSCCILKRNAARAGNLTLLGEKARCHRRRTLHILVVRFEGPLSRF